MGVMMELLKDKWGMKAPNLLISVTGSVTNINVKPLIKRLVDVAKDAGITHYDSKHLFIYFAQNSLIGQGLTDESHHIS